MAATYDAIVIGTGQAGPSLAVRLASAGMRVAIIERKRFGGTCVNTGCIPTKTLIASARAAHVARHAADYGVTIGSSIAVDMKKVKERKDAVVGRSKEGVESWLKGTANVTVYEGHARFEGAHRVRVGEEQLDADKIFINVGGRASVPPLPEALEGHASPWVGVRCCSAPRLHGPLIKQCSPCRGGPSTSSCRTTC